MAEYARPEGIPEIKRERVRVHTRNHPHPQTHIYGSNQSVIEKKGWRRREGLNDAMGDVEQMGVLPERKQREHNRHDENEGLGFVKGFLLTQRT